MPSTVQPTIVTANLEPMLAFYTGLLGATETQRVPPEGPVFYVGLRIGDSDLGLVSDAGAAGAPAGKILLSSSAARSPAAPTTCRGVSGCCTRRTRTATPST